MTTIGILMASLLIPIAIMVAALMVIKWWHARDGRRSTLNEKIFHQPGEQLRKRIADIGEDISEKLIRIIFIGPMLLLAIVLSRVDWPKLRFGLAESMVVVFGLYFLAWNLYGLKRDMRARDNARQGLAGELMTAQLLMPLMADGCLLYHDIPANKFNIDHVVIGPYAVFCIETKSRKKPRQTGKASANVVFDGDWLHFPDHDDAKPIEQVRGAARWLADHLRGAAGEAVPIQAVVALPGWYVNLGKNAHRSDVRVINPKMHSLFFDKRTTTISDSLRNRIAHALTQLYPDIEQ